MKLLTGVVGAGRKPASTSDSPRRLLLRWLILALPSPRPLLPALAAPRPSLATRAAWEAGGPSSAAGPKGAKGQATAVASQSRRRSGTLRIRRSTDESPARGSVCSTPRAGPPPPGGVITPIRHRNRSRADGD